MTVLPQYTPVPTRRQHKFLLGADQTTFALTIVATSADSERLPLARIVMRDLPVNAQITAVFHLKRYAMST